MWGARRSGAARFAGSTSVLFDSLIKPSLRMTQILGYGAIVSCVAVGLYLSLLLREKGDHEVVDEESTSTTIKNLKMTPHPSAFGCHLSRCGSVTLGL